MVMRILDACQCIRHGMAREEMEMLSGKTKAIIQVAATYIGTVIGAGFASGLSIMQFFTIYGGFGVIGMLISTALFIWIGTKMMLLARRIRAYSYQELNAYLFGPFIGRLANALSFIVLFGVTCVMLSGTGSIFEERFGLPDQLGILLSVLLTCLVMTKKLDGVLAVNVIVVPMMLFFSIIISIFFLNADSLLQTLAVQKQQLNDWQWMISPFAYTALNFATLQAVLVPLGSEIEDEGVLRWGGLIGGIGLGFMLLTSHAAMNSLMPDILLFDIPMAEVIADFGWMMQVLFLIVVYGEIFTTLVGNVFGMSRQIHSIRPLPHNVIAVTLLFACFLVSQFGFAPLLSSLYDAFGYMGLFLLVILMVKRLPKQV
jgi:uncharacterized membrane protein YkvI